MESNDQSLVKRYRKGDVDAAGELHDRFSGQMLSLVRAMLKGHKNRGVFDSEGIVQEGFKSFFSAVRKPAFDPEKGKIGGYLAAIVANKTRIKLRRLYPANVASEDLKAIADTAAAFAMGSLSEPEVNTALSQVVGDILDGTTPKEREILNIYLDIEDDRSPAEIARDCRRSRTTVHDVIDRFSSRLREQVLVSGLDVEGKT